MKPADAMLLVAIKLAHTPYIWGGNDPYLEKGVDCSGFVGYLLKVAGLIPEEYDDTAQGYYNRYKHHRVEKPFGGCLAFYGKKPTRITHIMFCVNERACMGAVRGNKWTDTIERALKRGARVDMRPIRYRKDLIAVVDPFSEV